jgi:hypothetical protein
MGKLQGRWGSKPRRSVRRGRLGLPGPSRLFRGVPGSKVDDAQEGSRGRYFVTLALLGC